MRTQLISVATVDEPITIDEARQHLNNPEYIENSYLLFLIQNAKEQTEHKLGRKLMSQTWEGYLDQFPGNEIEIPYAPLASVTSITYYDSANALQTVSSVDYAIDTSGTLPRIILGYGKFWPAVIGGRSNVIIIRFVTGYPTADAIPQSIKHYMKLLIGEYAANREVTTERQVFLHPGVERLLDPYRTNLGV